MEAETWNLRELPKKSELVTLYLKQILPELGAWDPYFPWKLPYWIQNSDSEAQILSDVFENGPRRVPCGSEDDLGSKL